MRVRLTMRTMIESNDVGYCVRHSSLDHVPMCHTAHSTSVHVISCSGNPLALNCL